MSNLTLHVDAERWRHHISHYVARHQGDLVPVIKGNGYGFGIPILAREASTFKDRKSTRLNSSHVSESRMPSSA